MRIQMPEAVLANRPAVFDGTGMAPREHFDAWHDAVNTAFVPLDATPRNVDEFRGRLINQNLGGIQLCEVAGTSLQVSRTARTITQNDPGIVKLGLQLRGYCVVAQDGREAALTPGDFALYDTTRPYDLYFDDTFRMLVLMLPADRLNISKPALEKVTASRVSGRQGLGALTSSLLTAMDTQLNDEGTALTFEASEALVQLISATFLQTLAPDAPHRDVILLKVKQYIHSRLGDQTLTVAGIAAANLISVRYLQKLFADHEETVSGWIRQQRLQNCRQELADPALSNRPIAAVGLRWGFSDAASFTRTFKNAYGYTPGEFRYSYKPATEGRHETLSVTPSDGRYQ
jgi:AraC-like DNA-binding protein